MPCPLTSQFLPSKGVSLTWTAVASVTQPQPPVLEVIILTSLENSGAFCFGGNFGEEEKTALMDQLSKGGWVANDILVTCIENLSLMFGNCLKMNTCILSCIAETPSDKNAVNLDPRQSQQLHFCICQRSGNDQPCLTDATKQSKQRLQGTGPENQTQSLHGSIRCEELPNHF